MSASQLYLVLSAVLVLLSDRLYPVFRESYSWWLVPVLLIGFFGVLVILQISALLLTIIFTNTKKPVKNEGFFRFLVKHSLPFIVLFARVKINSSGLEKLPQGGNILFVCNHQHDFDPVIIYSCFPDAKISFIGKKDIITEKRFIHKAMYRFSSLFIDRENDREAAKTIIEAIRSLKNDGQRCIGLFPEGYCSKTCELLPLRNGSLKIATKAKVPVAVCVVNNTREIPKRMFRRKTQVEFRLLDVIYPEDFENMTTVELGDKIYGKMNEALKEIRS